MTILGYQQTIVRQVARSTEKDDVVYRVAAHHPKGFLVHVVWNWLVFVGFLALGYVRVFHAEGKQRALFLLAGVFALLASVAAVNAVNATWWRRVCIEGTEVIILRGKFLIHRGLAYGRAREWRHPFDDVRKVVWRPRGSIRQYVSYVAMWRRFPNLYVVGYGLENESGLWLAYELAAQARSAAESRSSR